MKKLSGYIVTDYKDQDEIYVADRLVEEASALKITLDIIVPQNCLLVRKEGKTIIYHSVLNTYTQLTNRDFAIVRSHDGLIKNEIIKLCEHVYNNQSKCDFFHNKFNQVNSVSELKHSLKLIDSMLIPFQYFYDVVSLKNIFSKIKETLGVPFVLKDLLGHGGSGVFLINNQIEFLSVFKDENLLYKDLLAQKFISDSAGSDIRVFIIHGKPVAAMRRTSQNGDFRSNFSLGGKVEPFPVNKEIEYIASSLYKQTKLEIFGVNHPPLRI